MSELRLNTVTDKDTGKGVNVDALHYQNTQLVRNLGQWQPGLVFENKTDYATYSDQAIITNDDTPLPYTTQGADPTDGPDEGLVIPFAEVTRSDLVTVREDLLGPGKKLFMGDDGEGVKFGDTVPAGTTHLRYNDELLAVWGDASASGTVDSITANDFSGYDVTLSATVYEFVSVETRKNRIKGDAVGWGVDHDYTGDQDPQVRKWLSYNQRKKQLKGSVKCGSITLPDYCTLCISPGAVIYDNGTLGDIERSLDLTNTKNVTIWAYAATLTQEGNYTEGEQRHGVNINDQTENVVIYGLNVDDVAGDCFYIGTPSAFTAAPKNIKLFDVVGLRGRRQGLSITNVDGLTIRDGEFSETGRGLSGDTLPTSSIDIEPNSSAALLKGIRIYNTEAKNSIQVGLEINLLRLSNASAPVDIIVDEIDTTMCKWGIKTLNCESGVKGDITINRMRSINQQLSLIQHANWDKGGVQVVVDGVKAKGVNSAGGTGPEFGYSSAVLLKNETSDKTVGGLVVKDLQFSESPNVARVFRAYATSTGGFGGSYLIEQDATKIPEVPIIFPDTAYGKVGLSTDFVHYRELDASTDSEENALLETGSVITNRNAPGPTSSRLSSSIADVLGSSNVVRFLNVTGNEMTIFVPSDVTGFYPDGVRADPVNPREIKLSSIGESVTLTFSDVGDRVIASSYTV